MKKGEKKKNIFYKVKFIIIGNQYVGKTNLIHRFSTGEFKNDYSITLGIDFLSHFIVADKKTFKLELWDTAGSEKYRSITKGYYNNSTCALIVYDVTNELSFSSVTSWIEDCKNSTNKNINLVLVGNKCDLKDKRVVSEEDGKILAEKYGMSFYESSALDGTNIDSIFFDACRVISKNIDSGKYDLDDDSYGIKKCEATEELPINKRSFTSNYDNDDDNKLNKNIFKKKKKCC